MAGEKMPEYIAQRTFSLKYDDQNGKLTTTNVKEGEVFLYDGMTVVLTRNQMTIRGAAPNLAGAIRLGWAVLKGETTAPETSGPAPIAEAPKPSKPVQGPGGEPPTQTPTFDNLKGGDFEAFMNPKGVTAKFDKQVQNEESRTVKFTGTTDGKKFKPGEKMEVSGDQMLVKPISVTTSTASAGNNKPPARATVIRESDQDNVMPMKSVQARAEANAAAQTKKNSFIVNDMTPRVPDDASAEEVERALHPAPLEDQGAVTVRKIRKPVEIQETEGIIVKTTIGSGSTPVGGAQEGKVVRNIKMSEMTESSPEGIKLKGSVGSADKPISTSVTVSSGSTPISEVNASTAKIVRKPTAITPDKAKEFISKLPENWDKMFWQQKEEFINKIEDPEFIKYIMSVETIKTVQRLCAARLQKLKAAVAA